MRIKTVFFGLSVYLLTFVLVGIVQGLSSWDIDIALYDSLKFNITNLVLPPIATLISGYVVYKNSSDRRYLSATVLGLVITVVDVAFNVAASHYPGLSDIIRYLSAPNSDPYWLHVSNIILTIPMCLLGAWICSKREMKARS